MKFLPLRWPSLPRRKLRTVFTLLSIAGPTSPFATVAVVKTPSGEKLGATAWMMDCLFFPGEAAEYDCFRVQDSAALDAIGVAHEGKRKRDLYSYMDLMPASDRLFDLALGGSSDGAQCLGQFGFRAVERIADL